VLTALISFTLLGLVALGLWYAQRGENTAVVGEGNAFDAYYGKNRFSPGRSPPCPSCERRGCIGAGECRCSCHREQKPAK
jgi:hypothetical protein